MNEEKLLKLLEEAGIKTYDIVEDEKYDFLKVISQLATRWRVLSDDFKKELYEAMGLIPPEENQSSITANKSINIDDIKINDYPFYPSKDAAICENNHIYNLKK